MRIFNLDTIKDAINLPHVIKVIEEGFVLYTRGDAVIPPVAALHFVDPSGDCHIKYGYVKRGAYYVVKIASGFSGNPALGLPAGNGLMLLFERNTGMLASILLDEGYLTDVRTAAASAVAAKYLAPKNLSAIGIVGTGAQAFYQLLLLSHVTTCRQVLIWGRDLQKAQLLTKNPALKHFAMKATPDLDELTATCQLIVTTTSAEKPLLFADQIRAGTHITAVGADDTNKIELDPAIFAKASRIVVDSKSQTELVGDSSYALRSGLIKPHQIRELGEIIETPTLGRTNEEEITIADLTGVAIQDLQIATLVHETLTGERKA